MGPLDWEHAELYEVSFWTAMNGGRDDALSLVWSVCFGAKHKSQVGGERCVVHFLMCFFGALACSHWDVLVLYIFENPEAALDCFTMFVRAEERR